MIDTPMEIPVHIRRATPDDAAGIAAVMSAVVVERVHSAIDRTWTTEERRFLELLTARQAIHVAVDDALTDRRPPDPRSLDLRSRVRRPGG